MHTSDMIQIVEMISGVIATEGATLAAQQSGIAEIEDRKATREIGGVKTTITRTEDEVIKKISVIETDRRVTGEARRHRRIPGSLINHMILLRTSRNRKRRASDNSPIISTETSISRTTVYCICRRDLNEVSRHQAPLHRSPLNPRLINKAKEIVTMNASDDHHLREDSRIDGGVDQGTAASDDKKLKKRKKKKWRKKL